MKELTHWLTQNRRGWGKGATKDEALKNMRKATGLRTPAVIHRIHPDTVIYSHGMWEYPQGFEQQRVMA